MIQLSKSKIEEIKQELEILRNSLRKEQSEGANKGGPMDSFKEAAAFSVSIQAKEVKVRELEKILEEVIEMPEYVYGDSIIIGKWFWIQTEQSKIRYRIVDSREANPRENKISLESPLGKSVIGQKSGFTFQFNNQLFLILEVE